MIDADRHTRRPRYTGRRKTFKPYNLDQRFLLPPALRDWLPEGHLALFCQRDVSTTMIYTHVLDRGGKGVRSPVDGLTLTAPSGQP